jgi:hypothetical protein
LKAILTILCLALAGLGACAPALRSDRCESRCGSGSASRETREGNCEGILRDLCLAHCAADRGEDVAERLAALEAHLDHECGSGQPMAPEDVPRVSPKPTPNPLDRLLL